MTREVCKECVLKHIAQAIVLWDETLNGYPKHKHLVIGHLAEAESECIDRYKDLAADIRKARRKIYSMTYDELQGLHALNNLLGEAEKMKDYEGCGAC